MDCIRNDSAPLDVADPEAMARAMEACRQYLLMVAEREIDADLRIKAGASDIVQETFLEAHRDLGRFRGEANGQLQAWLFRILMNNVANFRRRFRNTEKRRINREVRLDGTAGELVGRPAETFPSPSSQAIRREESVAIARGLARLPETHRRALILRHREHRSFAEVARVLDLSSEDAARKLWARAVDRLRWEVESGKPAGN